MSILKDRFEYNYSVQVSESDGDGFLWKAKRNHIFFVDREKVDRSSRKWNLTPYVFTVVNVVNWTGRGDFFRAVESCQMRDSRKDQELSQLAHVSQQLNKSGQ